MLGVSPTLIRALILSGVQADLRRHGRSRPRRAVERRPVRLAERPRGRGGRIPIVNISGGTEVGACFLSVALTAPTKPVSLGFPALSLAMDVYSPEERPRCRGG